MRHSGIYKDIENLISKYGVSYFTLAVGEILREKRSEDRKYKNHIVNLGLSVRVYNCLVRGGYEQIADVLMSFGNELRPGAFPGFGETSYDELRNRLRDKGYLRE